MAAETINIGDPRKPQPPEKRFAWLALGFRPFYMLAALFSIPGIVLWAMGFVGAVELPMSGMWWHAHEMLFGFASAVIAGFLFTAARNWTGLPTPSGAPLAALVLIWTLARVCMLLGYNIWVAVLDVAFLPLVALALLRVLVKKGNRRNYFMGVLLLLLAACNLAFHLGVLGALGMVNLGAVSINPLTAAHAALALMVWLETVFTARILPMFTGNALPGVRIWRNRWVESGTSLTTALALLAWVAGIGKAGAVLCAVLCIIAACFHLVRAWGWNAWATRHKPILWILHLSCLWIPVGLLLLAATMLGWFVASAGVHALAIGATGGLMIGMITRTALGHTGRMLVTGRWEFVAYVAVQTAALVRVLTVTVLPVAWIMGVHLAATLWCLAMVAYLCKYVPILWFSRADGRPE